MPLKNKDQEHNPLLKCLRRSFRLETILVAAFAVSIFIPCRFRHSHLMAAIGAVTQISQVVGFGCGNTWSPSLAIPTAVISCSMSLNDCCLDLTVCCMVGYELGPSLRHST